MPDLHGRLMGRGIRELVATTHRTLKYLEFRMEELDRHNGHRRTTYFSMDENVAAEFMKQLNGIMGATPDGRVASACEPKSALRSC
jgi:hypothetical protein